MGKVRHQLGVFALVLCAGIGATHAAIPLTPADLQPPGDTSWNTNSLTGIVGTNRDLRIIEEQTPWFSKTWLLLDVQADGFPGGFGTSTNDDTIFIPPNPVGHTVNLTIPASANVALFLDVEDGSGAKGTGPNGILDPLDAYLSSNTALNQTSLSSSQYVKYYLADPTQVYSFTVNGQTSNLGNGCVAFLFVDDDHAGANFDFNDMIICIRGCLTNAECSDGLYCTGEEQCVSGRCQAGEPVSCDDGVECTVDTCVEETQSCKNKASNAPCSDGLWCNGFERCDPVTGCQPDPFPPSCDDGVPCTLDVCNEATDSCDHFPDNAPCSDGLFCNGVEICHPLSGCQAGAPPNCDDTIPCTVDACNESLDTCTHQPVNSVCNDNVFCNGVEVCDPTKGCKAGTPVNCADGVGCTVDVCDEATRSCIRTPNPALCDDGLFCNGAEICSPIQGCQAGAPPNCADNQPCTVDVCDEKTDTCLHQPNDAFCSDGLFCNGREICDPLQGCQSSNPPVCNDGVACTTDVCDEQIDDCVYTPDSQLCDNGLFCDGEEYCDPVTGCQPGPAPCKPELTCLEDTDRCVDCVTNEQCDDGIFCNGVEVCVGNECVPGTPPTCDDGVECTANLCDPATDRCVYKPNPSLCSNGLFCDGVEICDPQTGCQPGTPVNCDDGISCTTDTCNELKDVCEHMPDSTLCSNDLFCDGVEICDRTQGCLPGTPVVCNDGVFCTADQCNEATNRCESMPLNSVCDDGKYCNGVETCDLRAGCKAGAPVNCSDAHPCTNDLCDETTNSCIHIPRSEMCGDGVFCNGAERCDPLGGCKPGPPPDCNDGVSCTTDFCVETSDTCDHIPTDSACSDGLFCNGMEVCTAQGCQSGPPPQCDADEVVCTIEFCNETADSCDFLLDDITCEDNDRCTVNICTPGGCSVSQFVCGACCDGETESCTDRVPQEECVCPSCQWSFDRTCAQVGCRNDKIPTVSQWGLITLALFLLIGAKIRFGRLRSPSIS